MKKIEEALDLVDYGKAFHQLDLGCDLCLYSKIMKQMDDPAFEIDDVFKSVFDRLYHLRINGDKRNQFFDLLKRAKKTPMGYEDILKELSNNNEGRVEAVFSSKLLHTINPDMPIWDANVAKVLSHYMSQAKGTEQRIASDIDKYNELAREYKDFLKTKIATETIKKFNDRYKDYSWISDVKKIDFILWASMKK